MKFLIRSCGMAILSMSLMACTIGNGRICGPQTPRAYCDKEALDKLLHPKAYGEYFTKPGMTKEGWREDWVGCGGWNNGQYGAYVPPGSTSAVITNAWGNTRKKLDTCMHSKGYEFHREP